MAAKVKGVTQWAGKSLSAKLQYNFAFVKGFASHFNNFFTCAAKGDFRFQISVRNPSPPTGEEKIIIYNILYIMKFTYTTPYPEI